MREEMLTNQQCVIQTGANLFYSHFPTQYDNMTASPKTNQPLSRLGTKHQIKEKSPWLGVAEDLCVHQCRDRVCHGKGKATSGLTAGLNEYYYEAPALWACMWVRMYTQTYTRTHTDPPPSIFRTHGDHGRRFGVQTVQIPQVPAKKESVTNYKRNGFPHWIHAKCSCCRKIHRYQMMSLSALQDNFIKPMLTCLNHSKAQRILICTVTIFFSN